MLSCFLGPRALEKLVVHGIGYEEVEGYDNDDDEDEEDGVEIDDENRGSGGGFFSRLVGSYSSTLTHLDLSSCDVDNFAAISNLPTLRALLLYNVDLGEDSPSGFWSLIPSLIPSEIRYTSQFSYFQSWVNRIKD